MGSPLQETETALDHEIETIANAVQEHESMDVHDLRIAVGARYWGPGEFRRALHEAIIEQRIVRQGRRRVGRPHPSPQP